LSYSSSILEVIFLTPVLCFFIVLLVRSARRNKQVDILSKVFVLFQWGLAFLLSNFVSLFVLTVFKGFISSNGLTFCVGKEGSKSTDASSDSGTKSTTGDSSAASANASSNTVDSSSHADETTLVMPAGRVRLDERSSFHHLWAHSDSLDGVRNFCRQRMNPEIYGFIQDSYSSHPTITFLLVSGGFFTALKGGGAALYELTGVSVFRGTSAAVSNATGVVHSNTFHRIRTGTSQTTRVRGFFYLRNQLRFLLI